MNLRILKYWCLVGAIALLGALGGASSGEARKVTTRLKAPKTTSAAQEKGRIYPRHKKEFADVADRLTFMAYDKKASSDKETFFVDNGSKKDLNLIEIEITYYNMEGKQVHRRVVELTETFPANETRRVDIKSWDTQKSFHYINSVPSRSGSTPYNVKFKVLSFQTN